MTDTAQDGTLRTRRSLLTAAAGGAAALAVSAIKPAGVAAAPANMQTETDNATDRVDGRNELHRRISTRFFGNASGGGTGVKGTSVTGKAMWARRRMSRTRRPISRKAGVVGVSGDSANIASNIGLTGVYGFADASPIPTISSPPAFGAIRRISGSSGPVRRGTCQRGLGRRALTGERHRRLSLGGRHRRAGRSLVDGRALFSRSGRDDGQVRQREKGRELVRRAPRAPSCSPCSRRTGAAATSAPSCPESGKFTVYLNRTCRATRRSAGSLHQSRNGSG